MLCCSFKTQSKSGSQAALACVFTLSQSGKPTLRNQGQAGPEGPVAAEVGESPISVAWLEGVEYSSGPEPAPPPPPPPRCPVSGEAAPGHVAGGARRRLIGVRRLGAHTVLHLKPTCLRRLSCTDATRQPRTLRGPRPVGKRLPGPRAPGSRSAARAERRSYWGRWRLHL